MDAQHVCVVLSAMSRDPSVFAVEAVCLTREGAEARVNALRDLREPTDLMDQCWVHQTTLRP